MQKEVEADTNAALAVRTAAAKLAADAEAFAAAEAKRAEAQVFNYSFIFYCMH
jgi:hypothetical protein